MKPLSESRVFAWICIIVLCGVLTMVVSVAYAGGSDHHNNDTNVTTGDMVGGDTELNSRALAFSNTMGDVDIAGCLGSTQWATPLFSKQKLVVNWPCLTDFYLKNGLPEMASIAICNTEVRKEFGSEEECRRAHPFRAMLDSMEEEAPHDRDDELERRLEINQAYTTELESRLNDLEQLSQRTRTVVRQEPWMTDEKRAKLEAVLAE